MFKAPIFSALLLAALSGWAADKDYNYMPDAVDRWATYGTGKTETYDAAILVKNPCLVGKQITRVSMPLNADCTDATDCKVFLTRQLAVDKHGVKSDNVADIGQWAAAFADGSVSLDLPEPFTMTEEPLYVGVSFTTSCQKPLPVVVLHPKPIDDDGFMLHTNRTVIQWKSYAAGQGGVLPLTVTLSGPWGTDEAAIGGLATQYPNVPVDVPFTLPYQVYVQGDNPVTSLDYDYTVNGQTRQGHTDIDGTPLVPDIVAPHTVFLNFDEISGMGQKPMEVKITKANNVATPVDVAFTGNINVQLFVPVRRTLMEEGTGTWCANCPRGLVAIDKLNELYPDRLVAMGYHTKDAMTTADPSLIPFAVDGYPSAALDRGPTLDPFYGSQGGLYFGIERDFLAANALPAPASVEITPTWVDGEHIHIEATTRFVEDQADADYRLTFALLGNDLYNDDPSAPLWWQFSYYNDDSHGPLGDILGVLEGRGNPIKDYHFNDVVLIANDRKGIQGSLPSSIAAGEEMNYSLDYDLADVKCVVSGAAGPFLHERDKKNLDVAVILIDAKTGKVVNANKCRVPEPPAPEPMVLGYSNGTQGRNNTFGTNSVNTGMAMRLPASKTALMKGARVVAIETSIGTRNTDGRTLTLFLGNDPAAPAYAQKADIVSMNKWVRYDLETPFTITEGDLYAGFTATLNLPESLALSCDHTADLPGSSYAFDGEGWFDIAGNRLGCANVRLVVEGADPFTDVILKPFNVNGYHKVGTGEAYTVQALNFGPAPVTNLAVSGKIGNSQAVNLTVDGEFAPGQVRDIELAGLNATETGLQVVEITLPADADSSDNTRGGEQYFYPAEMERALLLEGFTGQECGSCPQGHRDIQTALGKFTGDSVIIVMHHSGFKPDCFTMAEDIDLQQIFHVGGAPSGMVNRGNSFSVTYSGVLPELDAAQATEPYAAMQISSSYSSTDGSLNVAIGVKPFNELPEGCQVNVMLCQNGMKAYQNSGGADYLHNEVYRGSLADDLWGVDLPADNEVNFSTTLPAVIRSSFWDTDAATGAPLGTIDWPTDPDNMYLVAFLADASHRILNSISAPLNGSFTQGGFTSGLEIPQADQEGYSENGPIRYYDLTGRMVAHPATGHLYIRVSGSQATKVRL